MAFIAPIFGGLTSTSAMSLQSSSRPRAAATNVRHRPPSLSHSSFVLRSHSLPSCKVVNHNTPSMLVVEAGSVSDMDTIINEAETSLVVVDYSTSWCGPCKIFAPIFEELSEQYKGVVFVKVMGDATPAAGELMKREGIRAVPAFHFWKNQKRIKDITGARKEDVEKAIKEEIDS